MKTEPELANFCNCTRHPVVEYNEKPDTKLLTHNPYCQWDLLGQVIVSLAFWSSQAMTGFNWGPSHRMETMLNISWMARIWKPNGSEIYRRTRFDWQEKESQWNNSLWFSSHSLLYSLRGTLPSSHQRGFLLQVMGRCRDPQPIYKEHFSVLICLLLKCTENII